RGVRANLVLEPEDLPAGAPHPEAELRLLAGDHGGVESARLTERRHAHHRDPAAAGRLAGGLVPFHVAEPVVHRRLGLLLPQAAADGARFGPLLELAPRAIAPSRRQLAVAVDELDELGPGM